MASLYSVTPLQAALILGQGLFSVIGSWPLSSEAFPRGACLIEQVANFHHLCVSLVCILLKHKPRHGNSAEVLTMLQRREVGPSFWMLSLRTAWVDRNLQRYRPRHLLQILRRVSWGYQAVCVHAGWEDCLVHIIPLNQSHRSYHLC